jgi:hypothetical protein
MAIWAVAFAVFEEGITTMSLFNPNFANLRLLDYGYIPWLGIAGPWTLAVLTLHAVWSIGVPIALVEAFDPRQRTRPWLRGTDLRVVAIVFVLGALAMTVISIATYQFVASSQQLVITVAVVLTLVIAGVRIPADPGRETEHMERSAANPWLLGVVVLAATSLYKLIAFSPLVSLSPWLNVTVMLGLDGLAVLAIWYLSRSPDWSNRHTLALAGGALLTQAWFSFPQPPALPASPNVDLIGNAVFSVGAVLLLLVAMRRSQREAESSDKPVPRRSVAA